MKRSFPNFNMRFFLLLLAVGNACNSDCVTAIYDEIVGVHALDLGWKDADMAVYGFILYHAATESDKAGGTLKDGFDLVTTTLNGVAQACDTTLDKITRDQMATCIKDATKEDVDAVKKTIDAAVAAGSKAEWFNGILGAVANQLAPGSLPAKEWTGLTETDYGFALKVYYLVGEFWGKVEPAIAAAFDGDEPGRVACFQAISKAVGYNDQDTAKDDLVAAIANKGEAAFGEEGLMSASCFGGFVADDTWIAANPTVTVEDATVDGKTVKKVKGAADIPQTGLKFTPNTGNKAEAEVTLDVETVVTELKKGFTEKEAVVTQKMEDGQPKAASEPKAEESSAAALSTLIAVIAFML